MIRREPLHFRGVQHQSVQLVESGLARKYIADDELFVCLSARVSSEVCLQISECEVIEDYKVKINLLENAA